MSAAVRCVTAPFYRGPAGRQPGRTAVGRGAALFIEPRNFIAKTVRGVYKWQFTYPPLWRPEDKHDDATRGVSVD